MGILNWLLGKKKQEGMAARPGARETVPTTPVEPAARPGKQKPTPEVDNLRRWRESGQARAWVEAHQGRWGHDDWLALLESLRRSEFWPMQPDAIGMLLEETRREVVQRN